MNHNQNFVQEGEVVTLIAPYDRLTSGLGALVGSVFGVSMDTVLNGASGQFERCGIHQLEKTSAQAWVAGEPIYWDNTNKRLDNTVVGPCVGTAAAAAANPSATGIVQLNECLARPPQAAVAAIATADGSDAATTQALANALKASYNGLLVKLRAAGIILP